MGSGALEAFKPATCIIYVLCIHIYYVDWGFDAVGTDLSRGSKHTVPYFHTVLALVKFLGVSQVKVKVWNIKDRRSS